MPPPAPATTTTRASLADLVRYFLYLGTFGFGGPVALIGFMHRIYPPALTPRIVRSSNRGDGVGLRPQPDAASFEP